MFYDVEKILDNRQINNKMEYLVRWEGYDQSHDQWIEESMFSNFNLIKKYIMTQIFTTCKDFIESLAKVTLNFVIEKQKTI